MATKHKYSEGGHWRAGVLSLRWKTTSRCCHPPLACLRVGGTHFCPQILIQPHLPGYYSPGGAGISLWNAGETTGGFHGDDTFANASPGHWRAHLVKLEQGFPLPPLVHPCGRWACRSAPRKDSSSLKKNLVSGVWVCLICMCVCVCIVSDVHPKLQLLDDFIPPRPHHGCPSVTLFPHGGSAPLSVHYLILQ